MYNISTKASPYLQNYHAKQVKPQTPTPQNQGKFANPRKNVNPRAYGSHESKSTQAKSVGVGFNLPAFTNYLTANSKIQPQADPIRDFIGNMINPTGGENFISTILGNKPPAVTKSISPSQNMTLPKRDKQAIIAAAQAKYQEKQKNKQVQVKSYQSQKGSIVDNMNQQKTMYNQDPGLYYAQNNKPLTAIPTPSERQALLKLYKETGDPALKKILTHSGNTPKQQAIKESRVKADVYLQSQQNQNSFMGKTITARDLFRY